MVLPFCNTGHTRSYFYMQINKLILLYLPIPNTSLNSVLMKLFIYIFLASPTLPAKRVRRKITVQIAFNFLGAVFKLPVGIVIGALEAVGLRNVLKQTGFLNKILLRIASKTPKNVSGKGFTEVVRNEIDSALGFSPQNDGNDSDESLDF